MSNRYAHDAETTLLESEEGRLRLAGRTWEYAIITPTPGSGAPRTMLLSRGDARYYLLPFLGRQDGLYEVVSLRHNRKLRDQGNRIVQVIWLGDTFQEVVS